MNRIDGKVAVVTGGTQGLGAATARIAAKAGAAGIVIVGRGLEKGQAVAGSITDETAVPVHMVAADPGNIDDVRKIIPETVTRFGRRVRWRFLSPSDRIIWAGRHRIGAQAEQGRKIA